MLLLAGADSVTTDMSVPPREPPDAWALGTPTPGWWWRTPPAAGRRGVRATAQGSFPQVAATPAEDTGAPRQRQILREPAPGEEEVATLIRQAYQRLSRWIYGYLCPDSRDNASR